MTDVENQGQFKEESGILYGADISSKGNYAPEAPKGYVFEGWYTDKLCTHKYTFDKMPKDGITVYAKWRQIQYRVFLNPNAGTDPSLQWGSDTQQMNFRISY